MEKNKKILIATPMLPPSLGGPAQHAAKISDFCRSQNTEVEIFNFEKLNIYPAGIRHIFAFLKILKLSLGKDILFAFDGFSVALPTVLVGLVLRKKVVLRIGGDLAHEQYVENLAVDMEKFYLDLKDRKINLSVKFRLKLFVQKFVLKYSDTIIFTTAWQKNIYANFYKLPKNIFVINNPLTKIKSDTVENYPHYDPSRKIFLSATRRVQFKNLHKLEIVISKCSEHDNKIFLDTEISYRPELLSRLKSCRAYICASLSDISPNTVLDALSLGTPVIMTKNSGFYELLKDKNIVRFIDPYDEKDMRRAVYEMCDDDVWENYKKNITEFLNKNEWLETWESLFQKYLEIINQ